MNDFEISYCSSHNDAPRRKHPNRKTFVAGDRLKWTRYAFTSLSYSREEYGYPRWMDDHYKEFIQLWGEPHTYYQTFRKWAGEPPRFNLKLLQRKRYELGLKKGIRLPKWLQRSKNSFV